MSFNYAGQTFNTTNYLYFDLEYCALAVLSFQTWHHLSSEEIDPKGPMQLVHVQLKKLPGEIEKNVTILSSMTLMGQIKVS